MSDTPEEILAAVLERFAYDNRDEGYVAEQALAALRESGWSLVRLDDCIKARLSDSGKRDYYDPVLRALPSNSLLEKLPHNAHFYLVPVGSGDTGGET